jgi:hypothetical protein
MKTKNRLDDFEMNVGERLQRKEDYEEAKKKLEDLKSGDWDLNPCTEQTLNIEINALELLTKEYEHRMKIFPIIDEEYWEESNAHIHWSLLIEGGFKGKQIDELITLGWYDLPQDIRNGLLELNENRRSKNV